MKKQPFKLTEQLIKLWKECVIAYLQKLYGKPLGDLENALMAPGVLIPRYKPRHSFLLEPNTPVTEAHYLKSGMAKLYAYDDKSGQPKIFYIWEPGSIIVLYKEFRENLPHADYYIELTEDSEVISITSFCMEEIYEVHSVAYLLTQKILGEMKKRMLLQMDILLTPAKSDRYALFEDRFPGLRGRLSNEEVCGFIGISMATLTNSKNED